MTRVTSQALNKSHGIECRTRCIFRWLKQAEMMRTWGGAANRSRCGHRRQKKLESRQSTSLYGWQALMRPTPIVGGFWSRDPRVGGVHRPDTSVPFHGYRPTAVCKNGQLELNPLWSFQPMKLMKERSDVIRPGRREHQLCGRVHRRLQPFELVWRDAG